MMHKFWENILPVRKLYDRTLETVCEKYDLQRIELDILLFLANNPEWDTATDIVEHKFFAKSHVSTTLRSLERKGYIERSFRPENRKTVHIRLCPETAEIIQTGQYAQNEFGKVVFASFTEKELEEIRGLLDKIGTNARRGLGECRNESAVLR